MRIIASSCIAAMLALLACGADAATLYKLIGKDGSVTYADQPPKDFAGKVVPMEVDTGPPDDRQAAPAQRAETESERIIRRQPPLPDDSEVRQAERELQDARAALKAAQESVSPDDWIYFRRRDFPGPSAPASGIGRAPKPEYLERLEKLEAEVKQAEEKLAQAQRDYRRSF